MSQSRSLNPKNEYGKEHKGNPIIWYHSTGLVPAPGPLPPARSARLYFLGRWQTTLVGGPQSTHPSWHIYTCWFRVASFPFLFWFTWKWDFATLPLDTYTHDRRYMCPGSSSGLMILKRKWWCTMALPSAMVHLLSLPPNWICDNLWPAGPVTPVPPDLLLWADRPLSGRTDFSNSK